jgi:hypothetical protein
MPAKSTAPNPNPSGLCMCGCGQSTKIAKASHARYGFVAGCPRRYIIGHGRRTSPVEYIVVDRGFESPCWEWQRYINQYGYGSTTVDGDTRRAHIVYYERIHGPVPEGKELHHRCENRRCVNPEHVEPLTRLEHSVISHASRRKLSDDQVRDILGCDKAISNSALARRYGIATSRVWGIRNRRAYRHVEPADDLLPQ